MNIFHWDFLYQLCRNDQKGIKFFLKTNFLTKNKWSFKVELLNVNIYFKKSFVKASHITPRYNSTSEKILKTVAAQGRRNVGYYRHSLSSRRDQRKWIGNWSNNVKESLSHFILLHYCLHKNKETYSCLWTADKVAQRIMRQFLRKF